MATLITLVDGTIPVAADFNTNFVNINTEVRTVPYGGTGAATLTSNGVLLGQGTSAVTATTAGSAYQVLRIPAAGGAPAFGAIDISQSAAITGALAVASGGTGLASGTSGGILGFTATGTLASSAALTANALLLGGGAGATPSALGSLGTTTTVLHGNAAGAPTFAAVSLTADVSGTLPVANGGTGLTSGTSGGVLAYTAAGTLASSAALTASALVIGGGAGAAPSVLALGTANYVLGMNSGATANEYKEIVQGSNMTITHAAGSITFAASSGLAAATQAEMEAASSTTVAATPGRTQYHPGVVKSWNNHNDAGTIASSYNVSSVTDTGVGNHTVTLTTAMSSVNTMAIVAGGYSTNKFLTTTTRQTASTYQQEGWNLDTPFAAVDLGEWYSVVMGDQ